MPKPSVRAGTLSPVSRRQILRSFAAAGLILATVRGCARAAGQASYFTWGGYDDRRLLLSYIRRHAAPPDLAAFDDTEDALRRLRAGFVADVVHPCGGDLPAWRQAGLLQPIDTARLSNWDHVFPRLKALPGARGDGRQWFAPVEWGQTSITYRTDLVDLRGDAESWGILWDARYRGRIAMAGAAEEAWWCAAIYAGIDRGELSEQNLATVRTLLLEQRPLVKTYTSDLTSVEQALASGELVVAVTSNDSAIRLKDLGVPVRFADPKEGALTWCCGAILHKHAPRPDKAHDLIDSLLSVAAGAHIVDRFAYAHANAKTFERVGAARLRTLSLPERPAETLGRAVFMAPRDPALDRRISRDWREILAGS